MDTNSTRPVSCDTFVILPEGSATRRMIFGKNSDRPQGEVQEIVYVGRQHFESNSQQKCTYIDVDSVPETYATILSKPGWMWGAEMGSNEFGVCIGNEAIWNRLSDPTTDLEPKKLLGMDMVRLALERSKTAQEALQVITDLLEKYGQGGPCSDRLPDLVYHNGFMIVDPSEAWVLETAGQEWAAEQVSGQAYRNISNCLSIETKIDRESKGLRKVAQDRGFWDGVEPFNFTKVYSGENDDRDRLEAGRKLLQEATKDSNCTTKSMIEILRNKESNICRDCDNPFPTTSSQVSVLVRPGETGLSCHWFTGTPDPQYSCFKPFIFDPTVKLASSKTLSPADGTNDRKHDLYRKHEQFYGRLKSDRELRETLCQMEQSCIDELEQTVLGSDCDGQRNIGSDDIGTLFGDAVESELRFYR